MNASWKLCDSAPPSGISEFYSDALPHPDRRVMAVIGDGSFGFTATDVNTAVRHLDVLITRDAISPNSRNGLASVPTR